MPTVTVKGADVVIVARPDEPILHALSRHGYAHTFGCRRGGCGICKVEIISGEVAYPTRVSDDILSPAERAAGRCLTCRAVAVTDTVIQLKADDKLRCVAPFLAAATQQSTIEKGK